jgi:hypothetical protein
VTDQELKALFEEEARAASGDVHVPAAGQIWWRSAIRARAESAHTAARPMVWLHALTGAGTVGMALGGLTTAWPWLQATVRDMIPTITPSFMSGMPVSVILAISAALVAAPIAFYLAVPRD